MEKLIQRLIEQHKLSRGQAEETIRTVTEYLKSSNPDLQSLIDHVMKTEDGEQSTEKPAD